MVSTDPTPIFIAHSFDHPEKYLRVQEFLTDRRVSFVDRSVPGWSPISGGTAVIQGAIRSRIARCERVIVVLTDAIHQSPWISQEIRWARELRKPIIGIYEHGSAGSPIPRVLAESPHTLIGWNSNSLRKAVLLREVHEYRVLDLAEDADRLETAVRLGTAAGAVSLLVAGATAVRLRQLSAAVRARGLATDLTEPSDFWSSLGWLAVGMLGGALVAQVIGRSRHAWKRGLVPGALLGGGVAITHACTVQMRRLGALLELSREPLAPEPASQPYAS